MLCEFLEYAQGEQTRAPKTGRTPRGGLLCELCRILDENGICYDVGVGDSLCGVEIGIKRSGDAQAYVLGIVTDRDGLQTQSVREYARLRAQVLTRRYGWTLHFVWQLAWFLDHEGEKRRLLSKIKAALL